jgi:hypothetical protein
MNATRRRARRKPRSSVAELLAAGLETKDDSAWYAQRIELLGRAIFGDLWDVDEPKTSTQNRELP